MCLNFICTDQLPVKSTSKTVLVENVAFFAYMETDTLALSGHHILIFDTVITNVLSAYHPHLGAFIAPRSGLYVFTWTIRLYQHYYHSTQLIVGTRIVHSIYLNPYNQVDCSVTGTAVVHVSVGDEVFIRTASSENNGIIISNFFGRSSFAGWSLT